MPRIPNKIIINCAKFLALANEIYRAFKVARKYGKEIKKLGGGTLQGNAWLKEDAELHLEEQEGICADLDKWMRNCADRQWALNDKRRRWIDGKL